MIYLRNIALSLLFIASTCQTYGQLDTKKVLTHKVILNEDDHNLVFYVKPVNNIPAYNNRIYYWFSGHEIKTTQGAYSGKLLNGHYEDFYLNKNLKESGWFVKGLKNGLWKRWNQQGVLMEEINWSIGLKNGTYHKYDEAGKLVESGSYTNDLLSGNQKVIAGDSTKVKFYKKGKEAQRKSIVPKFIKNIF